MRKRGSATGRFSGGTRRECALVLVEREPVAAVADRVRLDLDAAPEARDRHTQDLLRRIDQKPRGRRRVAVGREERRAAGTDRAIDIELDRAHGQAWIAGFPVTAEREQPVGVRARAIDRNIEPEPDRTGRVQPADLLDLLPGRSGDLQSGPAEADTAFGARCDRPPEVFGRRRRHMTFDEVLRPVDQHSGRLAGRGVAQDLAAGGIRRRARDARDFERTAVDDDRVTVGAFERHRPVGDHRIEIGARRKRGRLPLRFDPAAPDDPLGGIGGRALAQSLLQRREARHAGHVEADFAQADPGEMRMGIRQARQDGRALQVDDARAGRRAPPRFRRESPT